MNVIDMPLQVAVVTNLVFPIATLPDAALAFGATAGADKSAWRREKFALISDQRKG